MGVNIPINTQKASGLYGEEGSPSDEHWHP